MQITTSQEQEFYVLAIEGDLDASSSIQLDTAIAEAKEKVKRKLLLIVQSYNISLLQD